MKYQCRVCEKCFSSFHELDEHKEAEGHALKEEKRPAVSGGDEDQERKAGGTSTADRAGASNILKSGSKRAHRDGKHNEDGVPPAKSAH